MNNSRPSSEKHLLAVDGSNAGYPSWIVCKEWETLEHAVLSGRFSSDSSPQGSGVMWKGRKSVRPRGDGWLQRKPCLPDARLVYTWNHRDSDNTHRTCTGSNQLGPSTEKGKVDMGYCPQQRNYLQLIPTGKGKENQFSPMEFHWVYYTLGQAPCPGVINQQQQKNELSVLFS